MGTAKRKRELQLHALRDAFPDEASRAVAQATIEDARKLHILLQDMLDAELKDVALFSDLLQAAYAGHGFRLKIEVIPRSELTFNDQPTTTELVTP